MNLPKSSYKVAEQVGAEIARKGHVLVTGGTTGIGEYARRGNEKNNGINISLIPQLKETYNYIGKYMDIIISTGFTEEGRIAIMINSCDAVIIIGGSSGTLIETLTAYLLGKSIVVVEDTGLTTKNIKKIMDAEHYLDDKKLVRIHFAKNAKEAVNLAIKNIGKGKSSAGLPPVK
ncbi:LOG family protein [Candidatus Woesearchaeota archaeon]|nr:LOG family protein [Candidatus Woesearchaeota archaeon]